MLFEQDNKLYKRDLKSFEQHIQHEQDNKLYKRDLKSFEQHIVAADNSTLRIAYRFISNL